MEKPFVFWFDGIFLCILSSIGSLLNILSITVLWTKMIKFFHKLLICLFSVDCVVLSTSILWNLRWSAGLKVASLTVLYPYFILPFNHIAMTASIFLTIAIAYERYQATRNPMEHHQILQHPTSDVRRILTYLFPILIISILK